MSITDKDLAYGDRAQDSWNKLSELADLVETQAKNRAEFVEECKTGKYDGVVAAYRTFGSVDVTGMIDGELCKVLPKSLRFLAHNGMYCAHTSYTRCVLMLIYLHRRRL